MENGWSEIAAAGLSPFDGLERRLEVTPAEAECAVPFDELEEQRRAVLHRLGEIGAGSRVERAERRVPSAA
jgi:hypothetical protein